MAISHKVKTILEIRAEALNDRAALIKNNVKKQYLERLNSIYGIEDALTSTGTEISLAQVQDLLAKSTGWACYEDMVNSRSIEQYVDDEIERLVVAAAVYNQCEFIREVDASNSGIFETADSVKLATLSEDCVAAFDRHNVNDGIGAFSWPALVYVCCSGFGREVPELRKRRVNIVARLLELGADPNVGMVETDSIRGYRTVLGGAIGCARSSEVVELLLDAGATIDDGPTLYEGSAMWEAVRLQDEDSLSLLLQHDPPLWHICHALPHSLVFHNESIIRLLLDSGADVDWDKTTYGFGGTSLHEAVVLGTDIPLFKSLLESSGSPNMKDHAGRTAYQQARCLHREEHASILSSDDRVEVLASEFQDWVGACFGGDLTAAAALNKAAIEHDKSLHDHLWLAEAVRLGDVPCTKLLLKGELDPNVVDYRGDTPLHIAIRAGDYALVELLLNAGSQVNTANFDGEFALDVALGTSIEHSTSILELLLGSDQVCTRSTTRLNVAERDLFESAADTVSEGDTSRLREILDEHPSFVFARSPRPHKCTLMNYIGVNGFEGERQVTPPNVVEIVELLVARGADPNAVCYTYRGGPGENAVGLASSSGVPSEAGLMLPLISALVKGGARVDQSWQILVDIHEAKIAGNLDSTIELLDFEKTAVCQAFVTFASQGDSDTVRRFLAAGMNVNWSGTSKVTALHEAALNGNREMVDLLLSHGADLFLRDAQFGGPPAGWADSGGHDELTAYLVGKMREADPKPE